VRDILSKRVIITGAGGGIGAATATALRERGASVVGLDLNAADGVIACDVRDQASVDTAAETAVEELGGVDALINCAGIGLPQSAAQPPSTDASAVLDVNLMGTWRVTSALLPALRAAHGRVINISSGLAHIAFPFATAYGASKRAVVGYSDQLRAELGDEVAVTTVYPGYIRTGIHDAGRTAGVGLEGLVPAEPLDAAVRTLVGAVYDKPKRDLATTRRGAISHAVLRFAPKHLAERMVRKAMRRGARDGQFTKTPMTADFLERLANEDGSAGGR
jgi:NAD(P)-dependent dehydrogenase (short-subunit alcohol dehydrogenase family)